MQTAPNIILVTTHDSGRHFGCYGVREVDTPAVDSLAAQGVKMNRYFATVPICCASRASMLTGRYPQSHGLMDLCFSPFDWALRDGERHLSHILRDAGYRTCLFGMQHESKDIARLAFDHVDSGNPGKKLGSAFEVVDAAARFLRSDDARAKPFFAQIGFFESHTPFDFGGATPDDSRGVFVPPYVFRDEAAIRTCAALQGAIRQADRAFGQLLNHLRDAGLEENTLVVFTSDHGVELPRAKWFCYDPGIAVPLIMRWPAGGLTGGRCVDALLSNVDLVPTLLELIGQPAEPAMQGMSFAPAARGLLYDAPRDAIYAMFHQRGARAVRTDRYKLIRYFEAATDFSRIPVHLDEVLAKRPIGLIELFDLDQDPNEFQNRAADAALSAVRQDLDAKLWRWMESVDDPLLKGPVRTPSFENASADYQTWRASQQ